MPPPALLAAEEDDSLAWRRLVADVLPGVAAGVVAFPSVLAALQVAVWRPAGITANLRVAPLAGLFSFVMAHSAATCAFLTVSRLGCSIPDPNSRLQYSWKSRTRHGGNSIKDHNFDLSIAIGLLPNLAFFAICGGRLKNLLPSHLLSKGAFATRGIRCNINATSRAQREAIQQLGRTNGCHSCGSKQLIGQLKSRVVRTLTGGGCSVFHADHQPPSGIVMQSLWTRYQLVFFQQTSQNQKLYPQCERCSNTQGPIVRFLSQTSSRKPEGKGTALVSKCIVTHGTSLRVYHLWMPWFYLLLSLQSESYSQTLAHIRTCLLTLIT